MKKTVIIAAAGIGSRLGAGIPKCLVEIMGHPIFEYQLESLKWADEIRMVVGYHAEEVMKQVSAKYPEVIFVHNKEFSSTNLRQSYYLGVQGVKEKALFLDGDTVIGKTDSELLCKAYEQGEDFIAVVKTLSANPIYAGISNDKVCWFSYDRTSEYELANAAFMSPQKLEYLNTLFYVQLEEYLPTKAIVVESLEVDTPEDLEYAQQKISAHPEEYNFWR